MTIVIPSPKQRSAYPFDWQAERCRSARDYVLDAVTGQAATFARASVSTAHGSSGGTYFVGYGRPRFEWGALDFNDSLASVGVLLNGDALSFPFLLAPQALTVYVRFQKAGPDTLNAVVLAIGGATGGRLTITESASSGYTATYHNGTTAYTSTVSTRLLLGDHVELRVVLTTSALTLYQSVAGALEETGSASGALTLGASWLANLIYLGANAGGANPSAVTLLRAVVAQGSVPITAFRPPTRAIYTPPGSATRETEAGQPRETEASVAIQTEGS